MATQSAAGHEFIEKNVTWLIVLVILVVSVGGLVEIVPLFFQRSTTQPVTGVKPYTALQLTGRDIYIREGCNNCHSQMIRPFRDEAERYGHYSLAAESMYDHPFQWSSKRTGPDLARVGGKYSDAWQVAHLINPRAVVPESIMPGYSFLATRPLKFADVKEHLKTLKIVGVPYTDEQIDNAAKDLEVQTRPDGDTAGLLARYPKAVVASFDGDPKVVTEMDALVAYLQVLGTLVDFTKYQPADFKQ